MTAKPKTPAKETRPSLSDQPEELLEFLRDSLSPRISDVRLEPLEGDASTRKYYRIYLFGGPLSSVIAQELSGPGPENPLDLPFLNIRAHLAGLGLGVPEYYAYFPEKGWVVLEDLGDETLEAAIEDLRPGEREEKYRAAIDMLATMHYSRGNCFAFTYAFDERKFTEELKFFLKHAVEGLWGRRMPSRDRSLLIEEFGNLAKELASQPQVFTHRDYHSRNLMVRPGRKDLGLLDFQDARLGPPHYDLASLLYDSYVDLPDGLRRSLLLYYLDRADCMGHPYDPNGFIQVLRLTAVQRNLKAIGTFAYQASVLGRPRYVQAIEPTLRYVANHCHRVPELSPLWGTLKRHVPDSFRGPEASSVRGNG